MTFIETVEEVIRLAPADDESDADANNKLPGLRAHLRTLSEDVLAKLQTLMYFGINIDQPGDIHELHAYLAPRTHGVDDLVRTIVEKRPLATYLARGLTLAEERGIDLDEPF